MNSFQTIVVGLGAMGSAATYQLAKRGVKVLGIDQYTTPHINGSTHGETRITREAMGEGKTYTPLAMRSHAIWRELELITGQSLLTTCGGLIISNPRGDSTLHGRSDFLQQTIESADAYNIPYELYAGKEINQRFPQFVADNGDHAFYEPGAGFVRPERCVKAQLTLAESLGAEIKFNERLVTFAPHGDGVKLITDRGEYTADRLILSVGPWISKYLEPQYGALFNVYRQVLYWFDLDRPADYTPEKFPIFIWDLGDGDDMYGFPAIDGGTSIKVSPELYVDPTSPEDVNRTVSSDEIQEMFHRRISGRLAGVNNKCVNAITCLYTVTPDSHFIIDTLPEISQVIIASPCSGHGFKHSAAVGEVLADLAITGESKSDITPFSLSRFINQEGLALGSN